MRTYNAEFDRHARSQTKSPRLVVEISWDAQNTVLDYLTTHHDAALPPGASAITGVVEHISGTSQRVYPMEGRATIGDMTFRVIDREGAVTALFRARHAEGYGMRARRVRVYMGWEGAPWGAYELVQTQIISAEVDYDRGLYTVRTSDVQRSAREEIFLERRTRLAQSIDHLETTIEVIDASVLNQVEHGHSYQDAPPYSVGEVSVTNGQTAVTGTGGTVWIGFDAQENRIGRALEGGRIVIDGQSYLIASIESDTSLTLAAPFAGSTGQYTYTIYPRVGYIRIDDEFICYPAGGISGNTLNYCVRGRFRTRPAEHAVPEGTTDIDRYPRVDDIVYLEMPPPKLALAILTGSLWGQDGQTLPQAWHLAIPAAYVRTADFTAIGADVWDPDDDRAGTSLQFIAERPIAGKRFLEQQVLRIFGGYMPVYRDGSLGLKRITAVLPGAGHVAVLDERVIAGHDPLRHDQSDIRNLFRIQWNRDPVSGDLTRTTVLIDEASIDRHQRVETYELELSGLNGSRHTQNDLAWMTDTLRSRHAGAPEKIRLRVLGGLGVYLEIGDVVRLRHGGIRDYQGAGSIDRAFEIQQCSTDWRTGEVWLELFGSTERATPIAPTPDAGTDPEVIIAEGEDLVDYLNANYPGAFELVGSVGHIVSNCALAGAAASSDAVYFYEGDLEIDPNVTVTITQNVQIRTTGFLQISGTIDGRGQGLAGAANGAGTSGVLGHNEGMGGIRDIGQDGDSPVIRRLEASRGPSTRGRYDSMPDVHLQVVDGTIRNLPQDLRGSSGASSGELRRMDDQTVRASGGAGGAGLITVTRGLGVGATGVVDLSGGDGAVESLSYSGLGVSLTLNAAGAGGCPGGWLCVIDGAASIAPVAGLVAEGGSMATPGVQMRDVTDVGGRGSILRPGERPPTSVRSYYTGHTSADASNENFLVVYLPADIGPVPDTPPEAPRGEAISVDEHRNTPQTPNQNLCTLEVSVTAPAGADNYRHSNIYYRALGQGAFIPAGPAAPEALIVVPMDGTTYEIIARPVSLSYVESPDYVSLVYTVPTEAGGVVLGPGNFLQTGPNVGAEILGNGVVITPDGVIAFDSSGQPKVIIDAEDGTIYAEDGIFHGMIVAEEGSIGGWDITEDAIVSPGGQLTLDAGNDRIQAGPSAGTYVRMDGSGITGVDSVLGTTFRLPTDGSPPEFSSGVIRETVFEVENRSIIRTGVAVGGAPYELELHDGDTLELDDGDLLEVVHYDPGVIINDTGIRGYGTGGAVNFHIDATDGRVTARNADIEGTVRAGDGDIGGWLITPDGLSSAGMSLGGGRLVAGISGYGDTDNPGVFLGIDNGSQKMFVGDRAARKFLEFNGSDVVVGSESEIKGADAYNNRNIYFRENFYSLDAVNVIESGGSASISPTSGQLAVSHGSGAGASVSATRYMHFGQGIVASFANRRRFKSRVSIAISTAGGSVTEQSFSIGQGGGIGLNSILRHYGFTCVAGAWWGSCADGSSVSTVNLGVSGAGNYLLEAESFPGERVDFYVDGVLRGSLTTNVAASGEDTQAGIRYRMQAANPNGEGGVMSVSVGFIVTLEEPA